MGDKISTEVIHDLLVTLVCSTSGRSKDILASARYQFEDMIAKSADPMLDEEIKLPTKLLRISEYRKRTGCSLTTAHAVANVAYRSNR